MNNKGGFVYILTNRWDTVLYTGVTSALYDRVEKHIKKIYPTSFTAKYNVNKLVYYQWFPSILEAIAYEKKIKGGSRRKKIELITRFNPSWRDLYHDPNPGSDCEPRRQSG